MERSSAPRQGLIIAAVALTLVAGGAVLAVVKRAPAPPPTSPVVRAGSALAPKEDSKALDPLVQAMNTPPQDPAKMSLDATIATAGAHISVKFDRAVYSPASSRTWVAIATVGSADSSYETWTYVDDGALSAQLVAPTAPGDYEIRMHDDYPQQTFHVIARLPFKVESGLAEDPDPQPQPSTAAEHFTLAAKTVHRGNEIMATFPEPLNAKRGEKYWITITSAGESDSSYGAWQYVPAGATKTSLQAPAANGKYEMRLHGNYPTKSTNVVYRVMFEVD